MTRAGIVQLSDVGKRYVKYDDIPLLLTRALRLRAGHRRTHLWALRNVDLVMEPGEAVGVIGRNGAGKSTMLRVLAGVTAPTEGTVSVYGRVAPLIAVGVGFHPELTGRENVYVNAIVLGLRRPDIDRLFDSIVAFSEIGDFIDTPVKFYSSGMLVRLGFSVAVASRPDVLLIDEVLAVGDVAFQAKCFDRMEEIRSEGSSIVVVSHNLNSVRLLCDRTLVLEGGRPRFFGDTDDSISVYHEVLALPNREDGRDGDGGGSVHLSPVALLGEDGRPSNHVRFGEEMTFVLDAEFLVPADRPAFSFVLANEKAQVIYSDFTQRPEHQRRFQPGERARFKVKVRAALPSGSYKARTSVRWTVGEGTNRAGKLISFFVAGRPRVKGLVDLGADLVLEGGLPADPAVGPVAAADGDAAWDGQDPGAADLGAEPLGSDTI